MSSSDVKGLQWQSQSSWGFIEFGWMSPDPLDMGRTLLWGAHQKYHIMFHLNWLVNGSWIGYNYNIYMYTIWYNMIQCISYIYMYYIQLYIYIYVCPVCVVLGRNVCIPQQGMIVGNACTYVALIFQYVPVKSILTREKIWMVLQSSWNVLSTNSMPDWVSNTFPLYCHSYPNLSMILFSWKPSTTSKNTSFTVHRKTIIKPSWNHHEIIMKPSTWTAPWVPCCHAAVATKHRPNGPWTSARPGVGLQRCHPCRGPTRSWRNCWENGGLARCEGKIGWKDHGNG